MSPHRPIFGAQGAKNNQESFFSNPKSRYRSIISTYDAWEGDPQPAVEETILEFRRISSENNFLVAHLY